MDTGIAFLDDCLGGLYPRDLFLIGAGTGVGKTELAVQLAMSGVRTGRQVYMLALEAEPGEVASRLYYKELAKLACDSDLDYADWVRGNTGGLDGALGAEARKTLDHLLPNLHVLYKTGEFTTYDLGKALQQSAQKADMVVVDHLHVVDTYANQTDMHTQTRAIRILRDLALCTNIPVVAVSQLRKRPVGESGDGLPGLDDFYGASEIVKCATQIVALGREDTHFSGASPTYAVVLKDRKGRSSRLVARVFYRRDLGQYLPEYQLGKMTKQGWTPLTDGLPKWAVNCRG